MSHDCRACAELYSRARAGKDPEGCKYNVLSTISSVLTKFRERRDGMASGAHAHKELRATKTATCAQAPEKESGGLRLRCRPPL
ncbi:hypothetical protein AB1E18_008574 [Capra hircus]